jgi:vacuolar protein sorting-associated protein 3
LRHEEALRLLVHDLKDFQGAETYCYSGGSFIESTKSKADHAALQQELFPQLLGEYLRLETMSDRVTQTVNLLDRWGRFFDLKMVSFLNLNADMAGSRYHSR